MVPRLLRLITSVLAVTLAAVALAPVPASATERAASVRNTVEMVLDLDQAVLGVDTVHAIVWIDPPRAKARVVIQRRKGSAWIYAAKGTTNSRGMASILIDQKDLGRATYRASVTGGGLRKPLLSTPSTLTVHPARGTRTDDIGPQLLALQHAFCVADFHVIQAAGKPADYAGFAGYAFLWAGSTKTMELVECDNVKFSSALWRGFRDAAFEYLLGKVFDKAAGKAIGDAVSDILHALHVSAQSATVLKNMFNDWILNSIKKILEDEVSCIRQAHTPRATRACVADKPALIAAFEGQLIR